MKECKGIPASAGIITGRAFVYDRQEEKADKILIAQEEIEQEILRFRSGAARAQKQLEQLYIQTKERFAENAEIIKAQAEMAGDVALDEQAVSKIREELYPADRAIAAAVEEMSAVFLQMDNEYLSERAADVQDVGKRIQDIIRGVETKGLKDMKEEVIIIARELKPSETISMDFNKVLGIATEFGGRTSHTAIISRSMNLPAVVGAKGLLDSVKTGDTVILDAVEGIIYIGPEEKLIDEYRKKQNKYESEQKELEQYREYPAATKDGRKIKLCANIGGAEEAECALAYGVDGIGLYRTEMLFLNSSHFPTEEEQFEAYYKAAKTMGEKPVIIRTLDIGGDKELPYYSFEPEENPFLGWRAIRFCLSRPDIFKPQLKAILRANITGNLKIMFPMIISTDELRQAKELLEECKRELHEEGKDFNPDIETGVMIETPAAVLIARELAEEADFFSIGTNDLTQYILAVDRGNMKTANLYNAFHPAVLRSIRYVVQAAHEKGKWVGMCGEMAGDKRALELLLGLSLDELSMTASLVPAVKKYIRETEYAAAQRNTEKMFARIL